MCGSKLRCACGTNFSSRSLRFACVRCILRLAKCDHNMAHYFDKNERDWLSFGVSYNFVAQKCRILAIFYERNPFLGNYLEDIGILNNI